jgi:nucleotide-binding universal stress UspA family protein
MMKVLLPIDGSEESIALVAKFIAWEKNWSDFKEIHLINVQHSFHGDIGLFVNAEQMNSYHHDEGLKALEKARNELDCSGIKYKLHIGVGDPAEVIVQYANETQCDEIILSPIGLNRIASMILGSVESKIIELSKTPILLLK